MAEVEFNVSFAGPLVTVQDAGRPGNMRYGVPRSGPMDRLAFEAANAALGNTAGQTALEISLGGLILQCTAGSVTVAITGGDFVVDHAGQVLSSWTVLTIHQGERIAVRAGRAGSWAYLAFAGNVQANAWMGSDATHSTSGFGGGAVASGQLIEVLDASIREGRHGDIRRPGFRADGPIRAVIGPQDQHFDPVSLDRFTNETFEVTDAYDRMGMRLAGPELPLKNALSIPSEPILRGSVQVAGDGVPTVLLADHQTTGGYPKIATVISCDTDRLAQFRAGEKLRFDAISSAQALADVRDFLVHRQEYLENLGVVRGTLEQRLMRENLIHGCIYD